MRLGNYPCVLQRGTKAARAYQQEIVFERHRHRYEFNNDFRERLGEAGLVFSGLSPDGRLVEIAELADHPFMVGTQFHPELKSRPNRPHPLFRDFIKACKERAEQTRRRRARGRAGGAGGGASGVTAPRFAAILAGGSGTRLWPLSRASRPKQVLQLVGSGSLLRNTFERIRPLVPPERVFVLTERSHAAGVREQLPEVPAENVIVEPIRRGTAGSLALASLIIHRRAPDAVWVSLHSDHVIQDDDAFRSNFDAAFRGAAEMPHLFTLGIRPTYPSTQLGYIHAAEELRRIGEFRVHRVERFVEKPDVKRATDFVESGEYFWNPGYFFWSAESIRRQFELLLPEIYGPLSELADHFGSPSFQAEYERVYPTLPVETIDFGIMERAPEVAVIPATFSWSDIGSWKELYEALETDADGNVVRGEHLGHETRASLIFGGRRVIATVGLEDLVIVETEDVLLVARRDRAAEVKQLVERLEKQGRDELL
jgi:mannose-1-phosphate guanylyltransferase